MGPDTSVLDLVIQASFVVQLVILILLAASIASWAIIFRKREVIKTADLESNHFESSFWSGGDIEGVYREIQSSDAAPHDMAGIFEAGFTEFLRLREQTNISPERILEGSRRAMSVAQMRATDRLEENLETLATIGSTSPYIGLFGTVWGIMGSFQSLGAAKTATLAMVAPGISEALIATAMGLFAAIPAVIAYNRFADKVNRLELRYDTFAEELSTMLQRYAHKQNQLKGVD
ncbi:MAG: protein TolQ [Pseudomonadota bacterium]|nr:protein TolQ [Pseudomonadota bacterium]